MNIDKRRAQRLGVFALLNSISRRVCLARLLAVVALMTVGSAARGQFDCITNSGTITITGYSGRGGDEEIPSTINGLPVTAIRKSAFYNSTNLVSISIPDSVVSIGDGAFSSCTSLSSITVNSINSHYSSVDGVLFDKSKTTLIQCPGGKTGTNVIPGSVTSIGDGAFYGCTSLVGITIPSSVTDVGQYAFYDCTSLARLTIPNSVESIGFGACYGCSSLSSVSIPNSVTRIDSGVFSGCTSLTTIVIPNSVSDIGDDMFSGCTNLTGVTIPNSVTSIGDYAFFGCTSLNGIAIPNSVLTIGYEAFYGCSGLANITIPNRITSVGNNAFYGCSGLNSVSIPVSVTSIGDDAFSGCTNLTSIAIPNKVTRIGNYAFSSCTSLVSVTVTNSVTAIGAGAFSGCSSLGNIAIPNRLTTIANNTFAGCSSLLTVTIPSSVTSVGNYAFSSCTGLTNITIASSVRAIGNSAFSGCAGLVTLTVPNNVTSIGDDAFSGCTRLAHISLSTRTASIGNNTFAGCVSLTGLTIPSSVTSIGGDAFAGCVGLTNVTIPGRVTSIGNNAFSDCTSLVGVTFPSSVTSIGDYAFSGCTSLLGTTLPSRITTIGDYTFSGCLSLTSIVVPTKVTRIGNSAFADCTSLRNVTIPVSVTSIGGGAFFGCSSLVSIIIPNSVTSIGFEAFADCTALTSVFFQGNQPPSVDPGVFQGASNAKVYYLTGTSGWDPTFGGAPTALLAAPVIVTPPTNQVAQPGSSVTFRASAFGPLPIAYQWRLNGANIPGARATSIAVSAQYKNAGTYTVVAANSHGSVTSTPAMLFIKPTIAIASPKANQVVSNSVVTIQGTAAGDFSGGFISCRVYSNAWTAAQGTTNWDVSLKLAPGGNWIQAFATDINGNVSAISSNRVTYVPSSRLGITFSGAGSVSGTLSANDSASGLVAIGHPVTLTATAGTGQAFLGWSGWTNSSASAIAFAMPEQDLNLTAQFVNSPYPAAAGVYKGLIVANDPFDSTNSGAFAVTVAANGGYTVKLTFPSQTVSTSGQLQLYAGQTNVAAAQFTSPVGGRNVNIFIEIALDSSSLVTGSLTVSGSESPVARFDGAMVANTNLGLFNLAVLPTGSNVPAGNGFGSVTVSNTGVKINLTLADDKAVITASATDRLRSGLIPVFTSLYGNKGFFSGWLNATNGQILSAAPLMWHKGAGASTTFFAQGFDQRVNIEGSMYTTVTNLLQWGAGDLILDGSVLPNGNVDYSSATNSKGVLTIPVNDGTSATAWALASATGLVKLTAKGISGNGILLPSTSATPGIFGFTTEIVGGTGMVHSVYSSPAVAGQTSQ